MAVLVDTSVWIDHLRSGEEHLVHLLDRAQVVAHDVVIGELALGSLQDRVVVLGHRRRLPRAPVATTDEVLVLIDRHGLAGSGIGSVDAHTCWPPRSWRGPAAVVPGRAAGARRRLTGAPPRTGIRLIKGCRPAGHRLRRRADHHRPVIDTIVAVWEDEAGRPHVISPCGRCRES